MTVIDRVRVVWEGLSGLPGVSTLYFLDATSAMDDVHDFYDAFAGGLPSPLTITVQSAGDTIEDTTGNLAGAWAASTVPDPIECTGLTTYAGGTGLVVRWLTQGIVAGRRVQGRTFMVPLSSNNYDAGSLTPGILAPARAAASAFVAAQSGNLVVWSQPHVPRPGDEKPARAGSHAAVTAAVVPDLAAVLRSRRT